MKIFNALLSVFLVGISVTISGQAPQLMSYQSVIRNNTNNLVANQLVGMRVSILQNDPQGTPVYIETHAPISNTNGLVSIQIGNGNGVAGSMLTIDWSNGPYFIQTEIDPEGGSNYTITGVTQMVSVPYALYAENAGNSTPGPQGIPGEQGIQGEQGEQGLQGDPGNGIVNTIDNEDGTLTFEYTDGTAFTSPNLQGPTGPAGAQGQTGETGAPGPQGTPGMPGPQGVQGLQGQDGTSACDVIKTGDGRIVIYSATNARGFGFNEISGSSWVSTSLEGDVLGALASDSTVVIYTTTHAYGFGRNNISGSNWLSVALSAPITGYAIASGRIVVYNETNAYGHGFNAISGSSWYSTSLNGAPIQAVSGGGRIVVATTTGGHGFGYNEISGSSWVSTNLTGTLIEAVGTK